MNTRVLFLGGNGHSVTRLEGAQRELAQEGERSGVTPFILQDIPYPGFDGRPNAKDWPLFLDAVLKAIQATHTEGSTVLLYGTGIGGLILLCLRENGHLVQTPVLLQGPVLWGLKYRLMPRVMRFRPMQSLLPVLFKNSAFQRRFVHKYFTTPLPDMLIRNFFEGYTQCTALPDFFRWMTPELLSDLEKGFALHPERLQNISFWWGKKDNVVTLQELEWTRQALKTDWPLRTFPEWGHYPMIDAPASWVQALTEQLHSGETH